jgi:DNA-binding HxlR family transcriptional regulator
MVARRARGSSKARTESAASVGALDRDATAAQPPAKTSAGGRATLQALRGGVLESRDLDRLIHERVRLGIVSALAVTETLSFTELRDLLETSDGNLSVHARKLEEGGYIACHKFFEGRSPRTEYRLTDQGREALQSYLGHMEALIAAVKQP